MVRDMLDVITPELIRKVSAPGQVHERDDFIESANLTTVMVILPRDGEQDFANWYERACDGKDNVVPMSAKQLQVPADKDGNTVRRVVVFTSKKVAFLQACKERRVQARDFTYSEDKYHRLMQDRQKVDQRVEQTHNVAMKATRMAWSDVCASYLHLKAMRVFVESVLRFGVPAHFAAFVLVPHSNKEGPMRKALTSVLARQGGPQDKLQEMAEADGEEYP